MHFRENKNEYEKNVLNSSKYIVFSVCKFPRCFHAINTNSPYYKLLFSKGYTCEKVVAKQEFVKYTTPLVYPKLKQCSRLTLTAWEMLKTK